MCNDKNVRVNNTSADEFYEQLSNAIDEVPAHNLLAVIGDWNAKIWPLHIKFNHDKRTNENTLGRQNLASQKFSEFSDWSNFAKLSRR